MSLALIRDLYAYHWWANRRLFDVVAALAGDTAEHEVGSQFSFSTLRRMFTHLYGADALWLSRWKGTSPAAVPGADIPSLAALRPQWDDLEAEQRGFLSSLTAADLERTVDYRSTEGRPFRAPLGRLLLHVANHATHHRSEIATMLTMVSGSPPDTGLVTYHLTTTGQLPQA